MRSTTLGWLLCALVALHLPMPGASDRDAASEQEVKAAFLLNFARYVEWPAAAFDDPSSPIRVGVLGDSDIASLLEKVSREKAANGHGLAVRRFVDLSEAAQFHMIFLPAREESRLREISTHLLRAPVLIVSETEGLAQRGAMINFVVREKRVRFEINSGAATASGLRVSSNLLQLAILVGDGGKR